MKAWKFPKSVLRDSQSGRSVTLGEYICGVDIASLQENEVLRETARRSLAVRTGQTRFALVQITVVAVIYVLALWDLSDRLILTSWALTIVGLTAVRTVTSNRIRRNAPLADAEMLVKNEVDLVFTGISIPLIIGAGYWLLSIEDDPRILLAVTLISCIYAIGSAVNTVAQRRMQFLMVTLNLGQGILFFLSRQNVEYYPAALQLIALNALLLSFAKRIHDMFVELVVNEFEIKQQNKRLLQSRIEIEAALEKAVKANKSKSQFLAAASHDLSQPLYAMSLFISSLKQSVDGDEKIKELAGQIESTSEILKQQFEGLLDLSRYDAGGVTVQKETFNLYALCELIVQNEKLLAEQQGIDLKLTGSTVNVHTDPVLLGRLLGNLLVNAIKFTRQGSVELKLTEASGQAELRVIDTGCGFTGRDKERIFDDFVQLDNSERNRKSGAGLGLSIVRSVATLLDLKLNVRSEPGVGSEFTLVIPVSATSINHTDQSGLPNVTQLLQISGNTNQPAAVDLSGLSILLVDDDANNLDALCGYVHSRGGSAFPASTVEHGLIFSAEEEIHFAIIDDMLGANTTGLELASALSSRIDRNRIIIVTGNTEPGRLEVIRSAGFDVYSKPLTGTTLDEIISQKVLFAECTG